MKLYLQILTLLFFSAMGCTNKLPYGGPAVDPDVALNPLNFPRYWQQYINLSPDFTAFDTSGREITKPLFLKELGKGTFLPVRLISEAGTYYYKLYPIKNTIDDFTRYTLMNMGNETYSQYLWEGKSLPEINYTDLNGNLYNQKTINRKLIVIDFWFIGCTACVKEMPKLNRLANSLKGKDILFVSFAFDKPERLLNFLEKTAFHFDVISDTASMLANKLGVRAYPTQVIVGRDGNILKILDDQYHSWNNLMAILNKEL